jgi:hypothetical protein
MTASSINAAGKTGHSDVKRWKLYPYFSLCQKKNSTWTQDLNVRAETIKFLRKTFRKHLKHWYDQ